MCFDANLPGLDHCKENCDIDENVLCIHRFEHKVCVENFDPQRFPRWSDLRVFTYFLGQILINVAREVADPAHCVFMILTKDRNFIGGVRKEWEEQKKDGRACLPLTFSSNNISYGELIVIVQQIDCRVYGNKRIGDLKCAFHKVKDFFSK